MFLSIARPRTASPVPRDLQYPASAPWYVVCRSVGLDSGSLHGCTTERRATVVGGGLVDTSSF